ncbi:MAG: H-type small acid-soluble spore protein [Pseudomonadota bacterium]
MDIRRAEEILDSKGVIEVTWKNSPVWIESLVGEYGTAHVKLLTSDKSMNIPVNELVEK